MPPERKLINASNWVVFICNTQDFFVSALYQGSIANVYELKKAVTESGWLSDSKVKVPCTKTLVVANTDSGDDMLETASSVLLKT